MMGIVQNISKEDCYTPLSETSDILGELCHYEYYSSKVLRQHFCMRPWLGFPLNLLCPLSHFIHDRIWNTTADTVCYQLLKDGCVHWLATVDTQPASCALHTSYKICSVSSLLAKLEGQLGNIYDKSSEFWVPLGLT